MRKPLTNPAGTFNATKLTVLQTLKDMEGSGEVVAHRGYYTQLQIERQTYICSATVRQSLISLQIDGLVDQRTAAELQIKGKQFYYKALHPCVKKSTPVG